jgi:hypothetical protein
VPGWARTRCRSRRSRRPLHHLLPCPRLRPVPAGVPVNHRRWTIYRGRGVGKPRLIAQRRWTDPGRARYGVRVPLVRCPAGDGCPVRCPAEAGRLAGGPVRVRRVRCPARIRSVRCPARVGSVRRLAKDRGAARCLAQVRRPVPCLARVRWPARYPVPAQCPVRCPGRGQRPGLACAADPGHPWTIRPARGARRKATPASHHPIQAAGDPSEAAHLPTGVVGCPTEAVHHLIEAVHRPTGAVRCRGKAVSPPARISRRAGVNRRAGASHKVGASPPRAAR